MFKCASNLLLVVLCGVILSVTGCGKKEEPPAPPPKSESQSEVLRHIQEPQQRARDLEQQLLQRDQEQREAADRMS